MSEYESMITADDLLEIEWPEAFVVTYADGTTERLLRGDGVGITSPGDDPEGIGGFDAYLPKKHPQNKRQCGRYIRLTELRMIHDLDGNVIVSNE